jgi:hypothetical protein
MRPGLRNAEALTGIGFAHATAKKFDPNVFMSARLAADQYPLVRQVQSAADSAKFTAARLAGRTPPVHPDEEKTLDELRARVKTVVTYLEGFAEKDFDGAETRKVALPFIPGGTKGALGLDYFVKFAQPNFFFHIAHAYAILRHNGLALGKIAYIGGMPPLLDM